MRIVCARADIDGVARAKLHRSPSDRCFYYLYDGILCVVSIGRHIGRGRESSERWSIHDLPLVASCGI